MDMRVYTESIKLVDPIDLKGFISLFLYDFTLSVRDQAILEISWPNLEAVIVRLF